MYLFFVLASILHYTFVELHLVVSENTSAIANFIQTHELLFRIGIADHIIVFMSGTILSLAFYRILTPVNRNLALLALVSILLHTSLTVVIELSSFMALFLATSKEYLAIFQIKQLQALLGLCLDVRAAGYMLATLFFNLY